MIILIKHKIKVLYETKKARLVVPFEMLNF